MQVQWMVCYEQHKVRLYYPTSTAHYWSIDFATVVKEYISKDTIKLGIWIFVDGDRSINVMEAQDICS